MRRGDRAKKVLRLSEPTLPTRLTFYEFFAGAGMVRTGLGAGWTCLRANDIDAKKGRTYQRNFGGSALQVGDIAALGLDELPGVADLVWGSFPCQDLSLAGVGAGLSGKRSGTFHAFWDAVRLLRDDGRAPRLVAIENVCGALTSHDGRDFDVICRTFADAGYRYGALVINADLFVPQSRPRLFVVGVREDVPIDPPLLASGPSAPFHTDALRRAVAGLSDRAKAAWLWWSLPVPPSRARRFCDEIEERPVGVAWHDAAKTQRLLAMMSPVNRLKVEHARQAGRPVVGGLYRRTRTGADGAKIQRAEVRFDDVAGCLRTPAGGSSRQVIMVVDGDQVRTRLLSARETARLMGLPDEYILPANYNDAYHLTGDGVVVQVVRHLARDLLEPLINPPPPAVGR